MTGEVDLIPAGTYDSPDDYEVIDAEVVQDDEVGVRPYPTVRMLLDGFASIFDACHRGSTLIDDAWFVHQTRNNAEALVFFELLRSAAERRRMVLTVERQAVPAAHVVSWGPA